MIWFSIYGKNHVLRAFCVVYFLFFVEFLSISRSQHILLHFHRHLFSVLSGVDGDDGRRTLFFILKRLHQSFVQATSTHQHFLNVFRQQQLAFFFLSLKYLWKLWLINAKHIHWWCIYWDAEKLFHFLFFSSLSHNFCSFSSFFLHFIHNKILFFHFVVFSITVNKVLIILLYICCLFEKWYVVFQRFRYFHLEKRSN